MIQPCSICQNSHRRQKDLSKKVFNTIVNGKNVKKKIALAFLAIEHSTLFGLAVPDFYVSIFGSTSFVNFRILESAQM